MFFYKVYITILARCVILQHSLKIYIKFDICIVTSNFESEHYFLIRIDHDQCLKRIRAIRNAISRKQGVTVPSNEIYPCAKATPDLV